MKTIKLAAISCIILGALGVFSTGAIADTSSEAQRAEANIRVLAFATEAMQSQSAPAEFAAWPLPLRDTLTYWIGYRPFSEWSPELQKLALSKFRESASDTTDRSAMKSSVAQWLKEPEPTKNVELRFVLQTRFFLTSASAGFSQSNRIYQLIENSAYDIQELSSFLSSLSQAQRKELLSNKMRLPVARLTEEQKSVIKSLFGASPLLIGGTPLHEYADAKIGVDFQFKAFMRRSVNGKQEHFETLIARPFDNRADYDYIESIQRQLAAPQQ